MDSTAAHAAPPIDTATQCGNMSEMQWRCFPQASHFIQLTLTFTHAAAVQLIRGYVNPRVKIRSDWVDTPHLQPKYLRVSAIREIFLRKYRQLL
jgi:hypothetical protein